MAEWTTCGICGRVIYVTDADHHGCCDQHPKATPEPEPVTDFIPAPIEDNPPDPLSEAEEGEL